MKAGHCIGKELNELTQSTGNTRSFKVETSTKGALARCSLTAGSLELVIRILKREQKKCCRAMHGGRTYNVNSNTAFLNSVVLMLLVFPLFASSGTN